VNPTKSSTPQSSKYAKICLFNARSFKQTHKRVDLFELLDSNKFQVINAVETWCNDSVTDAMLSSLPGTLDRVEYNIFRKDRVGKEGGGICTFVNNALIAIRIFPAAKYDSLEVLTVDLSLNGNPYARSVCVYRPPNPDEIYAQLLADFIVDVSSVNCPVFICGDFNMPNVNWKTMTCRNTKIDRVILDSILFSNLFQNVKTPTRDGNILDLVLSSRNCIVTDVTVKDPFSTSDHQVVEFGTFFPTQCFSAEPIEYLTQWKDIDLEGASNFLSTLNWDELFENCSNVDDFYECFLDVIYSIIEVYVPRRKKSKTALKLPKNLRKLRAEKNRLFRVRDFTTNGRAQYNLCCRQLSREIKELVVRREEKIIKKENSKSIFAYAKSKLNKNKKLSPLSDSKGVLVTDDFEKSNLLNSHFSSIFTTDDGNLPLCSSNVTSSLGYVNFDADRVCETLRNLPNKLSRTPDNIPAFLLKKLALHCSKNYCANCICKPLSRIFRVSFFSGNLPKKWLTADVVPLYKKADPLCPNNYRPLSMTSISCKVMEQIIRKDIMDYMRNNDLLCDEQHGFISRRSVSTQLLKSVEKWTQLICNQECFDVVYTDFSKAFDSVSHPKLKHKLQNLGIKSYLLDWLCAFLSNRSQRVFIGGTSSNYCSVTSGVPQGTILAALMYCIYVNDVPRDIQCNPVSIGMYADDLKASAKIPTEYLPLKGTVGNLFSWSTTWQIPLSIPKCLVLRGGKNNPCEPYDIDGKSLESVDFMRDLGVMMSHDMSFSRHCQIVSGKAMNKLGMVFRAFSVKNHVYLKRVFVAFVRPTVEFSTVVWSPYSHKDIKTIERVQRKFTEKIFRRCFPPNRYTDYKSRCKFLDLDSLEYRRLKFDLAMCFKIVRGFVDLNVGDFFKINNNKLRGNGFKIAVKKPNSTKESKLFSFRVINVWNSLPYETVSSKTVKIFCDKIKHHELTKYLELHDF